MKAKPEKERPWSLNCRSAEKKMGKDIRLLIIDDDANIRGNLKDILTEDGYKITSVGTIASARECLKNKFYHITLVDLNLPDGSGLELVKAIKQISKETMVIILTGFASLGSAISALNEGAFAYIQKPFNVDELKVAIKRCLAIQELSLDNKNLLNRLKEFSLKDQLTSLYNYRYLAERLSSEFKRAKRYILPLSLVMIDLDYFKSLNDIYGHSYADRLLKEIAGKLLESVRGNDIVVRYGGDEFLVILPDTNKDGAIIFAKRLLEEMNEHIFDAHGKKLKLKLSMGLSSYPESGVNTESGLLNSVDEALRAAKEMGGNRLSIFSPLNIREIEDIVKDGGKENVDKLKEKLSKTESRANQTLLESIFAFAKTIEAKDYYTSEHSDNMVSIVTRIGRKLSLSKGELEDLQRAALLHDLGKIGIPDNILHKNGKLTKKEFAEIKKHPELGAEIIRSVRFLNGVIPIVLHHHERFDGLGYSSGLKGKAIPLGARIVAIADVYQALISERPYRKAYSKKEALKIIKEGSGSHFDPEIAKVFLEITRPKDR